ncbi:MAG: hypothetical protein KDD44_09670 [Bdellovibrionales bacterium]|nr:hypothetical protein [Bdellovibrionales bacterium]
MSERLTERMKRTVNPNRPELIEAREHILAAAALLEPFGPDFERVAWMLEDTLMYVDEALQLETTDRPKAVEGGEEAPAKTEIQAS